MKYELVGEWKQANYMLRTFPLKVEQAVNLANRDFSRQYARKVKENILNEGASLRWPPHSQKYMEFKESFSSAGTYQFFGVLLGSIKTFKVGNQWAVGIEKGTANPFMSVIRGGNTLNVDEYAAVLEKGSPRRSIPARPLWRPSYNQIKGDRGLQLTVIKHLKLKFPSAKLKF